MIRLLDKGLRGFLLFLVAFMILTVTWQVVSRYALRAPSSVTEEIARFQLIWLGLGGAVYTFRNRMHVGIDILTAGFTGRKRIAAELGSLIACAVFAALILVYGGFRLVSLVATLDQTSAALGVSMAWVYLVIPLSGVLILIYAAYFIRLTLQGKVEPPHAREEGAFAELPPGAPGAHNRPASSPAQRPEDHPATDDDEASKA